MPISNHQKGSIRGLHLEVLDIGVYLGFGAWYLVLGLTGEMLCCQFGNVLTSDESMKNPIITLLTDFGTKDHYVASMKGVILSINSRCLLIDITHQVSPHDIREGGFILSNAYSHFPKGTIHLAVVDPGVGGARRPLLLVTQNYFFVGPDNGLFTMISRKESVNQIIALDTQKYHRSKVSMTFHGRDIFAPVAAHLSMGVKPNALGHQIDSLFCLGFEGPLIKEGKLLGEILHVDTFGNLVSNIEEGRFFQFTRGRSFVIRAGGKTIRGLQEGYWEGKKSEPIALFGSGGFLEISVREGNAQKSLKVKRGDRIEISTKLQASSSK
jgi:S-adenosylmethionine hydrolase